MTKSPKKQTDLDTFEVMLEELIAEARKRRIANARLGDLQHVRLAVKALREARNA